MRGLASKNFLKWKEEQGLKSGYLKLKICISSLTKNQEFHKRRGYKWNTELKLEQIIKKLHTL